MASIRSNSYCFTCVLLFCWGLFSCDNNTVVSETDTASSQVTVMEEKPKQPGVSEEAATLTKGLAEHLTGKEVDYLVRLHQAFSAGVQQPFPGRAAAFAYQQNRLRIRLQMLDQQTINHIFPFGKDDLRLSQVGEPQDMSFISAKCGFMDVEKELTLHYPCLDNQSSLINYFSDVAGGSPLIQQFVEQYQQEGVIKDNMKSGLILSDDNSLDFTNPHHQLFYGLFQLFVAEEMEANKDFREQLAGGSE